jgi:hypothetical protein
MQMKRYFNKSIIDWVIKMLNVLKIPAVLHSTQTDSVYYFWHSPKDLFWSVLNNSNNYQVKI